MQPDAVPPDLAAALREAGYRGAGPVGVGAHGPAWAAVGRADGPTSGARVVATVLEVPAGPAGAALRARLAVLGALAHEHLAPIVDVVPLGGTRFGEAGGPGAPGFSRTALRWAVLLAEVPGVSLAVLLAARPPLSGGEVVTLVVPLAQAIAALHDVGLVHGDVSPANVVVRPDGRPVLVDLLGALAAPGDPRAARGTPGFVAPEVDRGDPPRPPADVHALARLGLAALAGDGIPTLRATLERACSPDPSERPSAAGLAAGCFATVAPEPLGQPDAAVLARTTLARLATAPSPRSAVTVRPAGSRHRAARRRLRTLAGGLVVAASLTVCAVLVAALVRGPSDGSSADATPESAATAPTLPGAAAGARGPTDPVAAAVALTQRRAVLLALADPAALADVEVVGGPAQVADVALLAGLAAGGLRIDGLAADVVSARLIGAGAGAGAGKPATAARVEVSSALTAHRRLAADGAVTAVPAQPARTVVLALTWTSAGWRVADVADGLQVAAAAGAADTAVAVSGPAG